MDVLIASFGIIFVSMLILVAIQVLRNDVLPTGCTPDGCRRCRKKTCPAKALDAHSETGTGQ